jgi:hypothetical protein
MTHLLHQKRLGPVPMSDVEVAVNELKGPVHGARGGNRTTVKFIDVHLVKCDKCGHESHNMPIPEHEDYVPDGWASYQDGTHRCPDCRTKRALHQDEQVRKDVIKRGGSVDDMRKALRTIHWEEPHAD